MSELLLGLSCNDAASLQGLMPVWDYFIAQVDCEQLRHRIGGCIYCASVSDAAARDAILDALQLCCCAEVAATPAHPLTRSGSVRLPRGTSMEAMLQHINQLPAHLLLEDISADVKDGIELAASEVLIAALRRCDMC